MAKSNQTVALSAIEKMSPAEVAALIVSGLDVGNPLAEICDRIGSLRLFQAEFVVCSLQRTDSHRLVPLQVVAGLMRSVDPEIRLLGAKMIGDVSGVDDNFVELVMNVAQREDHGFALQLLERLLFAARDRSH
jgi:hypothetical protein